MLLASNTESMSRGIKRKLDMHLIKVMMLFTTMPVVVHQMTNFISNDGQRIWDGIIMGPFILGGPMILITSGVYCVVYLGPWALVSIFIVIGFFPFMVSSTRREG